MSVDSLIKGALTPLGLPMEPGTYTGGESTYLTWNYDLIPVQYRDNSFGFYRAMIQVHLVAPLKTPLPPLIKQVMTALFMEGFTAPELVNTGETEQQHVVLECECAVPASAVVGAEDGKEGS